MYESRTRSQGIFTSPNFGQHSLTWKGSDAQTDCFIYSFVGQRDEIVELHFTHLDLAFHGDQQCMEFIRVFLDLERAEVNEASAWNYELCGVHADRPSPGSKHFSSFSNLIIEYHSVRFNSSGFKGRFRFHPRSKFEISGGTRRTGLTCAYDFHSSKTNREGHFFSPHFPQNYPPSSNCIYVFHGLPGQVVKLIFEKVLLEKSELSCLEAPDFVVIREDSDPSGQVIGQLCYDDDVQVFVSSGRQAYVDFIADHTNQSQGFQAKFEFIDFKHLQPILPRLDFVRVPPPVSERCSQNFTSTDLKTGFFSSPGHPRSAPSSGVCRYLFQGTGKERVKISFVHLDLSSSRHVANKDCDHEDSVTVTTFIRGFPVDLGIFCGKVKPPQLMSTDSRMEVTYVNHLGFSNTGFKAKFRFVTDFGIKGGVQADDVVCGFTFKSNLRRNGTFASPNFPGLYPRSTECHYFFFAERGEVVQVNFLYFNIEGAPPKCVEDFLEFSNFNIPIADRKMSRFCGRHGSLKDADDIISDGNFFRATFKSDDQNDGFGFEATYRFTKAFEPRRSFDEMQTSSSTESDVCLLFTFVVFVVCWKQR